MLVLLVACVCRGFLSSKASLPHGYEDGPILHSGCHSAHPAFGPPSNFSAPVVLATAQKLLKTVQAKQRERERKKLLFFYYFVPEWKAFFCCSSQRGVCERESDGVRDSHVGLCAAAGPCPGSSARLHHSQLHRRDLELFGTAGGRSRQTRPLLARPDDCGGRTRRCTRRHRGNHSSLHSIRLLRLAQRHVRNQRNGIPKGFGF